MKNVNDPFGFESMAQTWTQSVKGMMDAWSAGTRGQTNTEQAKYQNTMDNMSTAFKFWQSIASAMTTPESMNSFFKGTQTAPEMGAQFSQAVFDSFAELQKRMSKSAASFGESVDAYRFEQFDENMLHAWTDIYEKEFKKFFHIPQLGLTREYQERFNDMMDKFNQFQTQQAEFLRLMGLPFQRSISVMQEKIAEMADKGEMPDDINAYYQMWIKVLEGHFMTLFQTPEYIQALSKTISAMSRFAKARDAVFEDMIKGLPIAQQSEMDELAKEVYELKKEIRKLKKNC